MSMQQDQWNFSSVIFYDHYASRTASNIMGVIVFIILKMSKIRCSVSISVVPTKGRNKTQFIRLTLMPPEKLI